ncbi:DUF1638 domain-containing protein [Cognatishimia sp. SS12]|uniref:DUF1638 domain-containing protein n=1 Tax=Cognatishimia sp. SS12 TaxID=2979465 RepID=UPI00232E0D04|nr:DUF1638 domain-containing protein [Cognatishimia sp. SS12]MDC0737135.1 DUF1638 domain-containing protein [Cognatishimia sp. SS12]
MAQLNDDTLTRAGLEASVETGRVLLIACGALAREIIDLKESNGWDHMAITCLPAILHNSPQDIPAAVRHAVEKHRADFDQIFVVYADCGTGGQLQRVCDELGVKMVPGPHCYSFFEGNDRFAAKSDTEFTAFYLTDFLVRQFEAFVIKPLGLDRYPELRDTYFGHYEKLVYQAQTIDTALEEKARACAAQLGLAYEYRFTGYGDLETTLTGVARS